jgi:hypothetical protein
MAIEGRDRDLVLAPGEFAYVLDTTKGLVNVNVGPYKTSMAGTDQPVIWEKDKGTPFEGVMKQLGTHARMPVAQS